MIFLEKGSFEPWKQDRKRALKSTVLGAAFAGIGAYFLLKGNPEMGLVFGGLGLAGLAHGESMRRRANKREFGKKTEEKYTSRALHLLMQKGYPVQTNVMVPGVGDIDILVYINDKPVPIEIKSFHYWRQSLFFVGSRERKTLLQVQRQRIALNADQAFIWLPLGRPSFLQSIFGAGTSTTKVIFGKERKLVHALKSLK